MGLLWGLDGRTRSWLFGLVGSIGEDLREEIGQEAAKACASLDPDFLLAWVLRWGHQVASIGHD
jgi:hypothetical protein